MTPFFLANLKAKQTSTPIIPVLTEQFDTWILKQDAQTKQWVKNSQFKAASGAYCLVADKNGNLAAVVLGLLDHNDFWAFGALPQKVPEGVYHIDETLYGNAEDLQQAAMGWGLGCYQFSRYKEMQPVLAKLVLPKSVDKKLLDDHLASLYLARDLINTPAEDMGPPDIEAAAKKVAKTFEAKISVIKGNQLLEKNYPTVHAVGRAASREPRVIDLRWNDTKKYPKITLVGKGVCFDSGGLDIKPSSGMLLMKKDMAGSAMMLALAQLIMAQNLKVRLRLLIGAVENSVSGNSYRPGDVIKTRSGKTVEVTNTDAEGRLVLCDLLTEAVSEKPEMIVDFATLTGAGRVALGEDIPAFFANDKTLAHGLFGAGEAVNDPIWQLPLVQRYRDKLKSEIADLSNCWLGSPYGGAITAALFLQAFVDKEIKWAHFDTCAWNFKPLAGRPLGGEAFAIRAVFAYLKKLYE